MVKLIRAERIHSFAADNGRGLLFPYDAKDIQVGNLHSMTAQGLTNRMLVFSIRYSSRDRLFKKLFVLRIYRYHPEERMIREYNALKTLQALGIPVPAAFLLETDRRAIGEPFMIMEKVTGVAASHFLNTDENVLSTVDMLAKLLVSLHKVEPKLLFQTDVSQGAFEFRESVLSQVRANINIGYITSLSPFVRKRYLKAIMKLEQIKTRPSRQALVHLDFGPDHVLLTQNGPIVLDWEGIRIGDPAYDVGWVYHIIKLEGQTFIDHKFVKRSKQTSIDFDLGEEFVKCYEKYNGSKPGNLEFYKDLLALKLAATFDLFLRPGFYSLSRCLRFMPKEMLSQTVFARNAIISFKRYCEFFLQDRNILSKRR
jgi:aminoglycoside phosphotransferase (APT) family kinase protein